MKKSLIVLSIFIASCSVNKSVTTEVGNENVNSAVEISVQNNESILFEIKNTSNDMIYLIEPVRLNIEKFTEDSWGKLRILLCPCDAPCNQPKENEELKANGVFNLNWNKEESWCGTERINEIRNTETKLAEKGKYRIRIRYKTNDNEIRTIYKEFTIN